MARLRYNGVYADVSGTKTPLALGAALTDVATAVTFNGALKYAGGTSVPTVVSPDTLPVTVLSPAGVVVDAFSITAYTAGATTATVTRSAEGYTGVAHASGATLIHGTTTFDIGTGFAGPWVAGTYIEGSVVTKDNRTWGTAVETADIPEVPGTNYSNDFTSSIAGDAKWLLTVTAPQVISVGTGEVVAATGITTYLRLHAGGVHSSFMSAQLTLTYSSAGTIEFHDKPSTEAGSDPCLFYIDGVLQHTVSGAAANWTSRSYSVGVGSHVFLWRYQKDNSFVGPNDDYRIARLRTPGSVFGGGAWAPVAAATLDGLNDVDTSTVAPTTGQVLTWDGAQWEPSTVAAGNTLFRGAWSPLTQVTVYDFADGLFPAAITVIPPPFGGGTPVINNGNGDPTQPPGKAVYITGLPGGQSSGVSLVVPPGITQVRWKWVVSGASANWQAQKNGSTVVTRSTLNSQWTEETMGVVAGDGITFRAVDTGNNGGQWYLGYIELLAASAPYLANEVVSHLNRLWRSTANNNGTTPGVSGSWVSVLANTPPGVGAYSTTGTSIPNAVETIVPLPLESFDTDGYHDTVTNNSRVTIPAGKEGYYSVVGAVAYQYNPAGSRTAALFLNGSKMAEVGGTGADQSVPTVPWIGYLAAGDYLEIATYQSSGVALLLQTTGSTKLTAIRFGA